MDIKDFEVGKLGECTINNPIRHADFVDDLQRIVYPAEIGNIKQYLDKFDKLPSFETAGIRSKIFHDPAWSKAAIITAGGLCPGLNHVIKFLTRTLRAEYKIPVVYGIRYGYRGLIPDYHHEPIILTEDNVDDLHEAGGSILGSSRGRQDEETMVDTLVRMNINLVFCIGGDGTLRCAHDIAQVIKKRKLAISIVGIPKTIDNDISFIDNIVRLQQITRVPKAQYFFEGVINLRGEIIPVMSLRNKFDLEAKEHCNSTRIIIVKPVIIP